MAFKVFLDANLLLEYLLKRQKYDEVKAIFKLAENHKIKLYISSSILHVITYFMSKFIGVSQTKITLLKLMEVVKIIDGDHESAKKALNSNFNDLEDAIQYYIAIKHKMDFILTYDKDFQKFSLEDFPIVDVRNLIKKIS